jgi:hypothetical protein
MSVLKHLVQTPYPQVLYLSHDRAAQSAFIKYLANHLLHFPMHHRGAQARLSAGVPPSSAPALPMQVWGRLAADHAHFVIARRISRCNEGKT